MKAKAVLLVRMAIMAGAALLVAAGTPAAQEIEECLSCHEDRTLTKTDNAGKVHSLFVDRESFKQSVHGKAGHTCVDCHDGVQPKAHPADGIPDVKCGSCHSDVEQEHLKSRHGSLLQSGNVYAPKCQDCHTAHSVLPGSDPGSSVHPENLPATCGTCHEEEARKALCPLVLDFIKGKTGPDAFSLTKLLSPVVARVKGHGKVTMACEYNTRQCGSCHFDVVKHGDSSAKPRVCSTCHEADRSSLLFGKIHRSGVIQSTALSMLLVLGYLIVFAGVVMYVRRPAGKKEEEKPSGQQ